MMKKTAPILDVLRYVAPLSKTDIAWSIVLERYKQNTTVSTRKKITIAFSQSQTGQLNLPSKVRETSIPAPIIDTTNSNSTTAVCTYYCYNYKRTSILL